ncbi:MAG: PadR family transcriptional regulator [Haloarculaceae archaeon]
MSKWLQSGRRRDICIIVAGEGEVQAQGIKAELARRYDERIDPRSFRGALEALVETKFLETRTEGLHDVYTLTAAGENRLHEQFEWMREQLDRRD